MRMASTYIFHETIKEHHCSRLYNLKLKIVNLSQVLDIHEVVPGHHQVVVGSDGFQQLVSIGDL